MKEAAQVFAFIMAGVVAFLAMILTMVAALSWMSTWAR